MQQIELHTAFVLHARPYRNTSMIVDFFCAEHGRVSAVARGVRGNRNKKMVSLQAFTPLAINWRGSSDLVTLTTSESLALTWRLTGVALYSGIYLNELLLRTLTRADEHRELFAVYANSLEKLSMGKALEETLRRFELSILALQGFAIDLKQEAQTGLSIEGSKQYCFIPEHGFSLVNDRKISTQKNIFSGKSILAIGQNDFSATQTLRDAKRLMRQALLTIVGSKPLKSRELFLK